MASAGWIGKRVYGQKPLDHQLDELRMVREGVRKFAHVVTQMGNQRAQAKGRKQAVELLEANQLGRPVEANIWTGSVERSSHFAAPWSPIPGPAEVPENLSWDLWNGPLTEPFGYSEEVHPSCWRAYWDAGSGQLGDWGCHLIDVLYHAYDVPSPTAVQTNTIRDLTCVHEEYGQAWGADMIGLPLEAKRLAEREQAGRRRVAERTLDRLQRRYLEILEGGYAINPEPERAARDSAASSGAASRPTCSTASATARRR